MEYKDLKVWGKMTLNSYYGRCHNHNTDIQEEISSKITEEINNLIKKQLRQNKLKKLLK
jgi:hypothetical protein